jgi:hypothetical protein
VYGNEKENWRILTNNEIYAMVKKPTVTETVRLNRLLVWACRENGRKQSLQIVLYMNLGTTRLRGRPRNRWKDEVRENGRLVDGKGWKERVHNREEWKKLLRTARNCRILHMAVK